MAAKRDFRAVKFGMLTASIAAAGLVYWGIAANAMTERSSDLGTALYESVQPQAFPASQAGQDVTRVVVVPWPTVTPNQPQIAATVRSPRRVVVVPRPRGRTRAS